jgi:hypothetical protein
MNFDLDELREWDRLSKEKEEDPILLNLGINAPRIAVKTSDGKTYREKLVRMGIAICMALRWEFEKSPEKRDEFTKQIIQGAQYFTPIQRFESRREKDLASPQLFILKERVRFERYKEALELCFSREYEPSFCNHEEYSWVIKYLEELDKEGEGEVSLETIKQKVFIELEDSNIENLFKAIYGAESLSINYDTFKSFIKSDPVNEKCIRPKTKAMLTVLFTGYKEFNAKREVINVINGIVKNSSISWNDYVNHVRKYFYDNNGQPLELKSKGKDSDFTDSESCSNLDLFLKGLSLPNNSSSV